MGKVHFVADYEKLVAQLMRRHSIDDAMSLAVGGAFDTIGRIEAEALIQCGLSNGMRLADVGCGSGRAAVALSRRLSIEYDGYDVVRALLKYAGDHTPPHYRFHLNRAVTLPAPDDTFDFVCAFSLFTHLLHEETFIYMRDFHRVLRKGGKLVFSFLEFRIPGHWKIFEATVAGYINGNRPHLNMFMDRCLVETFAAKIGFKVESFVDATTPILEKQALGQSICVLVK